MICDKKAHELFKTLKLHVRLKRCTERNLIFNFHFIHLAVKKHHYLFEKMCIFDFSKLALHTITEHGMRFILLQK